MSCRFETITDLNRQQAMLRNRRYGVIEIVAGELSAIRLRPFPKLASWPEVALLGRWTHQRRSGDYCRLYYNQPLRHSNYLALKYVVSHSNTSFRSIRLGLSILDEIARLKRTDAILCDVANLRISDRMLTRFGWTPLSPAGWHRLFVKRFYGCYPTGGQKMSGEQVASPPRSDELLPTG